MRVLVCADASAGHIYPALSFLEALKDKDESIVSLLALPSRSRKLELSPADCEIAYISIAPVALRFGAKNFIAVCRLLKGSLESLILLIRFKPDIVVGFGGIGCVPLVLFAWFLRVKTLIHEQNVVPGKANRLLAKFCDKVAVSSLLTKGYLDIDQKRIALTGNPLRKELKRVDRSRALSFFGFNEGSFTILVMGGSLGSHKINMCFLEAVSMLPAPSGWQAIHISGEKDYRLLEAAYRRLNAKIKLFGFLKDMQYAYSISDLVVMRAGAGSIAEIINFALPAIIIPYPLAYKHQLSNAKDLEEKGCAVIINDFELNASLLKEAIEPLMHNQQKLKEMRLGYGQHPGCGFSAGELLVKEAMSLVNYQ